MPVTSDSPPQHDLTSRPGTSPTPPANSPNSEGLTDLRSASSVTTPRGFAEEAPEPAPSPIMAAVLAWLIPGAGHFYIGYNGKAALFLFGVLALVLAGSALGDWRVIIPPDGDSSRLPVQGPGGPQDATAQPPRSWSSGFLRAEMLWFGLQLAAGLVPMIMAGLNRGLEPATGGNLAIEVGHLYVRVGGMINLLIIADAYYRALEWGNPPAPVATPSAPSDPGTGTSLPTNTAHGSVTNG